jgi:lysophospholipase L1-like esterase
MFWKLLIVSALPLSLAAAEVRKFDFGSGKVAEGFTQVLPNTRFSAERRYGFEPGAEVQALNRGGDALQGDFITSTKPFLFSVALPEGNYDVTVTFGDFAGASTNTVKAESRRLMIEHVRTGAGHFETRTFTVNIRTPKISSGGEVRLKEREKTYLHWDNKLTLEFNGSRPCIAAVEVREVTDAITVYLVGDSTVTDQPTEPWNSWGQMLPRFLKRGVGLANHAESGESLKSSFAAHRIEKVLSTIRPGDYLFVQFGHNDMKDRATNALAAYKQNLERVVAAARERGATPVLVTSMERKAGVERDTLDEYPATVRRVAKEKNVALIDLHAMSKTLYGALGADIGKAFQDGTHHNNFGSYELARCVVKGIRDAKLDLARFLANDAAEFDPAKPDAPEKFAVPASPQVDRTKPEGN